MCSKSESGFWFHSEKYWRRKIQILLRTRKQYLARSIQTWCARDELAKLKVFLNKADVIESCSIGRLSTKRRFYKLLNLTVFAALLKNNPMRCKDAVLPEPLLKNCTINCLTFEENTRHSYNDNLCRFRAFAFHLHGKQLRKYLIYSSIKRMDWAPINSKESIWTIFLLLTLNILLYDIDFVVSNIIWKVARRTKQKYNNTVRLLRYKNHICYVSNNNAVFQSFCCPNCYTFFNRTFNLERHLTACCERGKNVFPRNVYQIRETLFDKLDSFGIKYTSEQKLFTFGCSMVSL